MRNHHKGWKYFSLSSSIPLPFRVSVTIFPLVAVILCVVSFSKLVASPPLSPSFSLVGGLLLLLPPARSTRTGNGKQETTHKTRGRVSFIPLLRHPLLSSVGGLSSSSFRPCRGKDETTNKGKGDKRAEWETTHKRRGRRRPSFVSFFCHTFSNVEERELEREERDLRKRGPRKEVCQRREGTTHKERELFSFASSFLPSLLSGHPSPCWWLLLRRLLSSPVGDISSTLLRGRDLLTDTVNFTNSQIRKRLEPNLSCFEICC